MHLESFDTDDDLRKVLAKEFIESDIIHGQWFDDGRRWCCVCQATRFMCEPVEKDVWADKTCPECTGLWPEFVEMVINNLIDDDDLGSDITDVMLN